MGHKYKSDAEEVEGKIKLMKNFWNILAMCAGSCLLTIILSIISSRLSWHDVAIVKVFLYAVILVTAIFSIVTLVTTGVTIYFKVTTLNEQAFKEAVAEIAKAIADSAI